MRASAAWKVATCPALTLAGASLANKAYTPLAPIVREYTSIFNIFLRFRLRFRHKRMT
jgi:hypothetical protein